MQQNKANFKLHYKEGIIIWESLDNNAYTFNIIMSHFSVSFLSVVRIMTKGIYQTLFPLPNLLNLLYNFKGIHLQVINFTLLLMLLLTISQIRKYMMVKHTLLYFGSSILLLCLMTMLTIIIFASFRIDIFDIRNHEHDQGNEHIHPFRVNNFLP